MLPWPGITEVRQSPDNYCIIGAGKTGADAVLHLLGQGVSPDKIIWIIPNDVWFMNRKYFTFDRDWVPNTVRQFETITSEDNKTWQDALLRSSSCCKMWHCGTIIFLHIFRMEKLGYFLRLDARILPTRSRIGSVSEEDIQTMRRIKKMVRKGRVARIEEGRVVFQSGEEMDLPPNTLALDCARNGSVFARHGLQVFDGDKINVQFVQFPPPGMSTTIIAALELKYPDNEEYKNSLCKTIPIPQVGCLNVRSIRNVGGIFISRCQKIISERCK